MNLSRGVLFMSQSREKFATQVNSKILRDVRALADEEGRQLQALVDEALADLIEKHKNAKPRSHVRKPRRSGRAWRRINPLWMATSGRLSPQPLLFLLSTACISRRTPKRPTFLWPTFTRPTSSDSTNWFPGYAHTWKKRPNTHMRRVTRESA